MSAHWSERVGETTVSAQWRCHNMQAHGRTDGPPCIPCEDCFTLVQTNVVVPYQPRLRESFLVVLPGAASQHTEATQQEPGG